MTIPEQIKSARIASGLSQTALAEKIDSDQKQIYRWENGKQDITVGKLELIAKVLGVVFTVE